MDAFQQSLAKRMTPTGRKNPLDRTTIVSVFPAKVIEKKETLSPSVWTIDKPADNDFALLVVDGASWWKFQGEDQAFLEIQVNSIDLAESIIVDYFNGFFGCNMADKMPGVFYIPGEYDKTTIQFAKGINGLGFHDLLEAAKIKQDNWFKEIVQMADIDWARTNGNPLSISDFSRMGAQHLKLQKPWMQDYQAFQLDACPACGQLTNLLYPVCKHCHHIHDKKKAAELGIVAPVK